MMDDPQKSDDPVVPAKLPNNDAHASAEVVEGRGSAKGNTREQNATRTQRRIVAPSALERVREAARRDRKTKFTALLHHVTVDRLRSAYGSLKRDAAPGADGVTWQAYGEDLEARLADLHGRLHRGAYRARPSRRVYIPKPDGRDRPLGIASLEDKIVQRATVEVLNAIYETDFVGFSYGFRPKRSQHHALDALAVAILRRRVNWVLDADIRGSSLARRTLRRPNPRQEPSALAAPARICVGGGPSRPARAVPTAITRSRLLSPHRPARSVRSRIRARERRVPSTRSRA